MNENLRTMVAVLSFLAAIGQFAAGYFSGSPIMSGADAKTEKQGVESCCHALVAVVQNQSVQCKESQNGSNH